MLIFFWLIILLKIWYNFKPNLGSNEKREELAKKYIITPITKWNCICYLLRISELLKLPKS